jgi:mannose-6-phosphate isomerase
MSALYPLKFAPVFKEKIWGGKQIATVLGKDYSPLPNCGEMWVLSGIPGDESVVLNGYLEGNELSELCEVYMDELLGEKVYEKYGEVFPLLIKFIDTTDWLSVQVHPDDDLALKNHGEPNGKTEMWYILKAGDKAELNSGFNADSNKEEIQSLLQAKQISQRLKFEKVNKGDVFFIPAGRVHAIGPDILLAEIQQSSDITYRIYDWDRFDVNGLPRELHTELGLEAIDYSVTKEVKESYTRRDNIPVPLVNCPQFTTNLLCLNASYKPDYSGIDSFVALLCTSGKGNLVYAEGKESLNAGEVILLPAGYSGVQLVPDDAMEILEVYIDE